MILLKQSNTISFDNPLFKQLKKHTKKGKDQYSLDSLETTDNTLEELELQPVVFLETTPDSNEVNTKVKKKHKKLKKTKKSYSDAISNLNGGFLYQLQNNYNLINEKKQFYYEQQEELEQLHESNKALEYRVQAYEKGPTYMVFVCWSILFVILLLICFLYLIGEEKMIAIPIRVVLVILFIFITITISKNIFGIFDK